MVCEYRRRRWHDSGATRALAGALCALALLLGASGAAHAQIISSKHNLSASGPGTVKATTEDEICLFCHAPHNASAATPLWNRTVPPPAYTPYSSSMLDSGPGQPTNASKLCLSCHDGTIALGAVNSRPAPIAMSGALPASHDLTTDLSDDHPISFVYNSGLAGADGELHDPSTLTGAVTLDSTGQLQCTSCHDAHSSSYPNLLLADTEYSALCITCHDKDGWTGAIHESSAATWNSLGVDPWPHTDETTVETNACESCHDPHGAGSADLLLNEAAEEDNCLSCHNGNVATLDIEAELSKSETHAVGDFLGVHDPPELFNSMARHVECVDCHNPHAATTAGATAPNVTGALEGTAGVTTTGAYTDWASFEYEVCYRCHADNPNVPAPYIPRMVVERNLRLKFDTGNPSHHGVEAPGQNNDVPSLIAPWTEASILYCTDCHNNDDGPNAGGSGPNGPHGSDESYLLEREYRTADFTTESAQAYALCYKCHDRATILNDVGFDKHDRHIGDEFPCSGCHDPHGVRAVGPGDHTHLINFDTSMVFPDRNGRLEFVDLGFRAGECYLDCHGKDHSPKGYSP